VTSQTAYVSKNNHHTLLLSTTIWWGGIYNQAVTQGIIRPLHATACPAQ